MRSIQPRFVCAFVMAVLLPSGLAGHFFSDSPQDKQAGLGTITGALLDPIGRPIEYANVVLVGTTRGAMTHSDGSFTISNVPAGLHYLKAMMMGYQSIDSEITVTPGDTVRCEIKMNKLQPRPTAADSALVGSEIEIGPDDFLCEIHLPKTSYRVGDRLELAVQLQNLSGRTFYLVGCLRASQSGTPYPYALCVLSGPDMCAYSSVAIWLSASDDALHPTDFIQVSPGDSVDLFGCGNDPESSRTRDPVRQYFSPCYSLSKPGRHTIYFRYVTFAAPESQWSASAALLAIPREVETLLKQVPRIDVSCSTQFEVEE